MRIALDAMGGDHAPEAAVAGAIEAVRRWSDLEVRLVGSTSGIEPLLRGASEEDRRRLPLTDASDRVEMGESPVGALRRKASNSISRSVECVAKGESDALVSAGHTGAAVAAATLGLGRLEGVRRPGIAVCLPTLKGECVLIDVGANIASTPEDLLQYALMGSALAERVLGRAHPTVGVLNIGEEEGKGTPLVLEAARLIRARGLPYHGFVEGRDIFQGTTDVVVCDGFAGNVVLKASEGLADAMFKMLEGRLLKSRVRTFGAFLARGAFRELKAQTNYAETGGALLLGARGTCLVAHGRSNPQAFASALGYARRCVQGRIDERILEGLRTHQPVAGAS
ncbi:MAG: phosphate acyltransferase PlsX [Planctomycetes bacterium]|nr:phosphate acyltransferase PlsX [Planctomycetota bacterium]